MNPAYSDPQLLQWTLEIAKRYNLTTFLETGTYLGWTSKIVSNYFEKVITIENNYQYYLEAVENLKENKNCYLYHGSSYEVMDKILKEGDDKIFFFLDAHWYEELPLLNELKIIKDKKIKPIIAIHDFFVPDENGMAKFGFDTYGDQRLDFEYIKKALIEIYGEKFYIKFSSESTNNSGVIYILPYLKNE